ncbi:PCMD domain-containing protein [Alistipes communis]|uniref:PCMD domain-containing protein n=1 Tax=Alistipes communis TaxID=2585118 RepID=UPI0026660F5F|nr:PCMD domain-containing protein [Alistipes communis]
MKHAFTKGLFVAATATLIAACSTDDAADQMPVAPGKIEVSLKAALPQSRAQIEVDESNGRFSGSWEATDELTVYAKGSTSGEETPKFTYDADAKVFKGQLTEKKQDWTYQAVYPAVDATPLNIPFGAERTQKGSNFNGAYDPLVSVPVTHVGAEPGKTPQGEAVTFGLNRLTAILALTFETDDATVKAEKVKSVALTAAGKTIAAKSFDITLGDQSGALNASEPSETITLSYEAGSEPTAASFKAYFNVPAATYGKLSVVITTEGHTASLDLTTDGIELLPGELAYTTKAVTKWDALAPAAAPTMEWVGHTPNAEGEYEPEEIKKPMDVKVNIQAEAGIESFIIKINSPILATILQQLGATDVVENTVTLDLIDGTDGAVTMVKGLLLPEGLTDLRGYSELLPLDLSGLVPLILDLGGADPNSIVGNHIFTLSMTDTQNSSITRTLTFYVPAPPTITYAAGAWNDMATFTLQNIPADAQTVKVQYKTTDESQWHDAEVNSDRTAAIVRPEFTSHTSADWTTLEAANVKPYKRKVAGTGILDGKTYQYKLIVDSFESEVAEFDSAAADRTNPAIPALDQKELSCYTTENNTDATWWGSGNNTFAKSLCKHDATYKGAHLKAESGGLVAFVGLAPGNLFSGKFYRPSTDGTVYFGQPYQWAKRPSGVKVQYDAKTGNVNNGKHGWKIAEGSPDYARIFVAIVNWEKTRDVTSGMSTPKGCWDPETSSDPSGDNCGGGQIVAYASLWISQTALKGSFNEVTLPFNWYAEDVNPANANYSLVISCSTSAYGDYLNGYKSAEMYVGDFEWVY